MINNDEVIEKLVLVAVDIGLKDEDIHENLDELEELVKTAGGVSVARLIQNKDSADNATYIGKGKVEELKDLIYETEATGIVCDDELSPIQMKNLEDSLDVKILDRTMVILDIFANRATTSEGKIQVELAQLKYRSSRLIGMRSSLSRLGGGIGTRGPGEKKLEIDRRIIKSQIAQLQRELNQVKQHREVMRKQRLESNVVVLSIVGYTNAGKSTLLNKLTNANVLEEDKLFATLDPTSRNLKLESGQEVIVTDTVGFIRKLPHHLINAFRSTLEESKYADIILHVVDISNPQSHKHIYTVYETLNSLEVMNKPIITVFNKIDKLEANNSNVIVKDFKADKTIKISARDKLGFDELKQAIEDIINNSRVYIEKLISYNNASIINQIRKYGTLISEEYQEDGIFIKAYVDKSFNI